MFKLFLKLIYDYILYIALFGFVFFGVFVTSIYYEETTMSFSQMIDGKTYESGIDIPIEVSAADPGGIRNVTLYINDVMLTTDNSAPYQWPSANVNDQVLQMIEAGEYDVRAVAIDTFGNETSIRASFTVEDSSLPNPLLEWADSYSADGQCYCNSDYSGGIGDQLVDSPYGQMTVRQFCADLGPGPGAEGNPLYNDIQCGNGIASNEENETTCPGRVDNGTEGCNEIGPNWQYPDPTITTANPAVNAGPLQNPLKGFHIGFDATCCLEFPNEVYFGNFMASVGYQNFNWADLEPQDDVFNWDLVEDQLSNRAGSKQKHVIVQLNAEWTLGDRAGRTPQWFLDDPRFEENVDDVRGYRSHKYESAFYKRRLRSLLLNSYIALKMIRVFL